jgi:ADP-ribose diphosphatase
MSNKKLPVILSRDETAPGHWMRRESLDLEFQNGARRTYSRLITHGLGAVIIVPMLDDQTVLLAREYACGMHHYELGLPKGRLERDESVLEGANREMMEEIGYGARDLREINAFSLAPGYMTHITHIVLARDLYEEKLPGDEPEDLEVVPWPINDLRSLADREDCTEGRTIAALYYARDYLQEENAHD